MLSIIISWQNIVDKQVLKKQPKKRGSQPNRHQCSSSDLKGSPAPKPVLGTGFLSGEVCLCVPAPQHCTKQQQNPEAFQPGAQHSTTKPHFPVSLEKKGKRGCVGLDVPPGPAPTPVHLLIHTHEIRGKMYKGEAEVSRNFTSHLLRV